MWDYVRIIGAGMREYADIVGRVEETPDLAELQELLKGVVRPLLSVPSKDREGYEVTAWVADERFREPDIEMGTLNGHPFRGGAVVIGTDPDGNMSLVSLDEAAQVELTFSPVVLALFGTAGEA